MDRFEYITQHKNSLKTQVMKALIVLTACVVFALLILMSPFAGSWAPFLLLFLVGLGYGTWKLLRQFNLEYEFSIFHTEIEIDKIIDRRRRKHIISLDLKNIKRLEPLSEELVREHRSTAKMIDASSGNQADTYAAQFNDSTKGVILLLLSPNETLLNLMKKYLPKSR